MKFKSIDQSKSKKTPTPPKISIRPHITPLNKTPIDGIKTAQTRQHPMATAPLAPRRLEPKAEAAPGRSSVIPATRRCPRTASVVPSVART